MNMFPSILRVGIVGHRFLNNDEVTRFVTQQSLVILKDIQSEYSNVIALSAISEGSDSLFAEAAIELGIPLDIVRPFDEYAADFTTAHAKRRYELLRSHARSEILMEYVNRSDKAYLAAMNWVVKNSDILVAAWNGYPASGSGGTGDAVEQVIQNNRAWIHIDVVRLCVTFHSIKPNNYKLVT